MLRGLVHESASGQYTITDQYQATGAPAAPGQPAQHGGPVGGVDTSASTTAAGDPGAVATVDSHLDSFFESHALTREDVMVVAAGV